MGKKICFNLTFDEREVIVEQLRVEAESLGITEEQLIKRFIADALEGEDSSPSIPGNTLEDFLIKNEALSPRPKK
ncbi:hypothetical protein Q9252_15155 [Marinobacter salarius]|uniref:hypothetical protein n=1 Tax=Marinobacter salarius TaxID=1420917 RepID=UPI00273B2AED|nr:hypothetical protein [Marinobacter salarius]MDP4533482.1 hypothetical protein [Marinobacter salarius]